MQLDYLKKLSIIWLSWLLKPATPKTYYVREAILEHLDELEEKYLAVDRLEKSGKRWALGSVDVSKIGI